MKDLNVRQRRGKNIFTNGQSLGEAVIVLATAGSAILGMQVYVQRGIQGKTKDLTDAIIGKDQRSYTAEKEWGETDTRSFSKNQFVTKKRISAEKRGSVTKIIDDSTTVKSDTWSIKKD